MLMKLLHRWWARLLFQDRGVLPTGRLISFVVIITVFLTALSFVQFDWRFMLIAYLACLLISLLDLLLSPKRKELELSYAVPNELERHVQATVKIYLKNRSSYRCVARLTDDSPQSFRANFPNDVQLKEGATTTIDYAVNPLTRGEYRVKSVYVRYRSLIGLWEKQKTFEGDNRVKVIPNLENVRQYLASPQRYLLEEGVDLRKQRSGNGEFAKVRRYVVGDDPRKINWYQTAKQQHVMTNEYEPEHGKQITLLVDCGRMMGAELATGNRLERSIEAVLTVATAALKKGDYVSVILFAKAIKVYVPPKKGMAHLDTILQSVYKVQVDPTESNYQVAMQYAQSVQKKRSLMILFSDVYQFLLEDHTLFFIKRVQKKHLFLLLGIEDEYLQANAQIVPKSVDMAMLKAVSQKQIRWKKQKMFRWQTQGVTLIESPADRLAVTAVSRYIDQLNRGAL